MKTSSHQRSVVALGVLAGIVWQIGQFASAQDAASVSKDECVLELILPEGATVTVDGSEYGTKRSFTFPDLRPKTTYVSNLSVQLADGSTQERNLLIRAGWRASLPMQAADLSRPELLVQTARPGSRCFALSPDQRYFAVLDSGGNASLWDVATGRLLRSYRLAFRGPGTIAFTPDGSQLVTGSTRREAKSATRGQEYTNTYEIVFWDLATGKRMRSWDAGFGYFKTPAAFSADGQRLVTCHPARDTTGKRGDLTVVWNVATGESIAVIDHGEQTVNALSLHPDGRYCAIAIGGKEQGAVLICDTTSGEIRRKFVELDRGVTSVATSPNGQYLVTGSYVSEYDRQTRTRTYPGEAILWEWTSGEKIWQVDKMHVDGFSGPHVAFLSDSEVLVTEPRNWKADPPTTCILDAVSGNKIREFTLKNERGGIKHAAALRGSTQVLVEDKVYDRTTGNHVRTLDGTSEKYIRSVEFDARAHVALVNDTMTIGNP